MNRSTLISRLLVVVVTMLAGAGTSSAQMVRAWSVAREGTPCRLLLAPDGDLVVGSTIIVSSPVSGTFHDCVVARYSPGGQLRWRWQSGESQDDLLHDLALDQQGDVIAYGVIGTSFWGQAPFVARIIKLTGGAGERRWTSTYSPQRSGFNTYAEGVRIAPDGGIYIFGQDNGQTTQVDLFVARYSPAGAHEWTFRRSGPVWDFVFDLAFDGDSNAYWAGSSFRPGTSLNGGCVGKLSPSGQQQWVWLQPVGSNAGGALSRISVDRAGNIVATGHNEYFPGYQDGVLLRMDPSGQALSHTIWDGPDGRWDRFFTHAVLSDNTVVVSGDTYAGDGPEYYDVPTIRFNGAGAAMWTDVFGSTLDYPNDTEEWSQNMFALPGDEVLTISTDWARPGYDYALHRYAADGALLERIVHVLPSGSADIKDVPARCAVHDPGAGAVFLLGWGAGPASDPATDHYTLIRIDLPLPPACRADFTGDGIVNSADFFDFLAAFFNALAEADFNADGVVNSQDFFEFLADFFAGC